MTADLLEIVGVFGIIAGCCTLVGAAGLVSVALAVAVAGAFLVLAGVLVVFIAAQLDKAQKAAARVAQPEPPPTVY